jgi:hypothetical protein
MQVHAYAGSVSRNQVPTSHIKNPILVCPINIFLSATDGQLSAKFSVAVAQYKFVQS